MSNLLPTTILATGKFNFTQNVLSRRVAWAMVDALNGGTAAMRAAETLYLPMDVKEDPLKYETRLSRSVLDNYYTEAVDQSTDKIFSRDITLKNQPAQVQNFWNDVDGAGRDGNQFLKDVLRKAFDHGVSYVLTDYPELKEQFKNKAEEDAAAPTPYWVIIEAPSVIAIQSEVINGREQLTFFQWEHYPTVLDTDGISYVAIQEVRSFMQNDAGGIVSYQIDRCVKGTWQEPVKGDLNPAIKRIPLTPFYGNREGFFIGSPVFMALAELNVAHFGLTSDLQNILHVANVPFLFGKGFGNPTLSTTDGRPVAAKGEARPRGSTKEVNTPKLEVDIHNAVMSTNPNADIKWVEHTGSAISIAIANIQRIETRMKELGAALFTTKQSGNPTATGQAINAAEANARLKSIALAMQDSIEMAIVYVAAYMGATLSSAAKFEVNTSFSVDFVSESTFTVVQAMYDAGAIDWDTYIAEAKRRNIIALDTIVVKPKAPAVETEVSKDPAAANEDSQSDKTTPTPT